MLLKWGIKHRVLVLALMPAFVISVMLGVYFTNVRLQELVIALHARGINLTTKLASSAEYGISAGNKTNLRELAQKSIDEDSDHEVRGVSFYNIEGEELASYGKITNPLYPPETFDPILNNKTIVEEAFGYLAFTTPVTLRETIIDDSILEEHEIKKDTGICGVDNLIGWVKVEFQRSLTRQKGIDILWHSAVIVLFSLTVSGLIALRMGQKVTQPIIELTTAVEKIKKGDFETRIHTGSRWELEVLESGFNTMASALQEAHGELQNKIDQATADLRHTLETIEIQNIELENARQEAEDASRIKSEFLASMSHELRTPLNGLVGFIKLLEKTDLSHKQQEFTSTIHKSSQNLLKIINDILDFSKIEAGKFRLDCYQMNLRECVEDALTLLAPAAHEKSLELVPFIYSDVPVQIVADALRIKQVITNLVSNSIKFTDTGSIIVRVMLDDESEDKIKLCFSVTDTGIGLSEDEQTELFRAFNQVFTTAHRKTVGSGLGLVICKKLVEQMNGEIHLESTPGRGSTFWFTIEVNKSKDEIFDDQKNSLSGIKVLLFEKHPVTKLAITHLLKYWGVTIETINSVDDIIPMLKESSVKKDPFSLVLIGINQMQEKNFPGKEVLIFHEHGLNCPVGVLVNTTDHNTHDLILQEGASICLAKPVCYKKLHKAFSDILYQPEDTDHAGSSNRISVLVVDDNLANLKLLQAFLENYGVNVTTAIDGREAIEILKNRSYDLIFMDLQMPIINGIETTHIIRTELHDTTTPILAVSAHAQMTEKNDLYKSGINGYLTKPISEHELQAVLYKWTRTGTKSRTMNKTLQNKQKHKIIDLEVGAKLCGGKKDLALEMIEMLLENIEQNKEDIKKSYENKHFDVMRNHVHKLHGACCYCGVPFLKPATKSLEIAIISREEDKIQHAYEHFTYEIDRVINHAKSLDEMVHESY